MLSSHPFYDLRGISKRSSLSRWTTHFLIPWSGSKPAYVKRSLSGYGGSRGNVSYSRVDRTIIAACFQAREERNEDSGRRAAELYGTEGRRTRNSERSKGRVRGGKTEQPLKVAPPLKRFLWTFTQQSWTERSYTAKNLRAESGGWWWWDGGSGGEGGGGGGGRREAG